MELSATDRIRVGRFIADLAVSPNDASSLPGLLPRLRELLALDVALVYSYRPADGGVAFDFAHGVGFSQPMGRVEEELSKLIGASRGQRWGVFDPLRPEPAQRNRAWRVACARAAPGVARHFEKMGIDRLDQVRALVLDGDELLGWVGGCVEGFPSSRQRMMLQAMVPALRRLLWTEARLREATLATGALSAAMEAIGAAVFVASARGQVLHANSFGAAELARDPRGTASMLQQALHHPTPELAVTRLAETGAGTHYLVVRRSAPRDARRLVTNARERYGLTWREVDVLALLAEGASNRAIAAALRCAERTVEVHVTHLLGKVGVPSRAALVARFWMDARRG